VTDLFRLRKAGRVVRQGGILHSLPTVTVRCPLAGIAEKWDAVEIDGSLETKNCAVSYKQGGKTVAVATIGRDIQSLQFEAAMEASLRKLPRAMHG